MKRSEFLAHYKKPQYLGDSVYAHFDGYHIILETRNGLPTDPSNTIALESNVLNNLTELRRCIYRDAEQIQDDTAMIE